MSATAVAQEPTVEPVPHAGEASKFGRWSDFIDVGEGAQDCPDHGADCTDPDHFHAWVRLPNGLVHRDIRERALAAQARRTRLLRDEDSDAGVVLENEIEELRAGGVKVAVVDALVQRDFASDYPKAVLEVQQRDEFERVLYDQEEFLRLEQLREDERPADEYEALRKHLAEYAEAVQAELQRIKEPKRQALEGRDLDDLLVEFRAHRVEQEAAEEYLHVYGTWELIACAYHPKVNPALSRPGVKLWKDIDAIKEADAEHIDACRQRFDDLRASQSRAVMGGNS